jgi:hypothetical protein
MAKKIKIDPDHKPLDNAPFGEKEYEDGGWYIFERWAGVSWFGGKPEDAEYKERYGTIRSDTGSRFPIVTTKSRQEGISERTEQSIERNEDFD